MFLWNNSRFAAGVGLGEEQRPAILSVEEEDTIAHLKSILSYLQFHRMILRGYSYFLTCQEMRMHVHHHRYVACVLFHVASYKACDWHHECASPHLPHTSSLVLRVLWSQERGWWWWRGSSPALRSQGSTFSSAIHSLSNFENNHLTSRNFLSSFPRRQ